MKRCEPAAFICVRQNTGKFDYHFNKSDNKTDAPKPRLNCARLIITQLKSIDAVLNFSVPAVPTNEMLQVTSFHTRLQSRLWAQWIYYNYSWVSVLVLYLWWIIIRYHQWMLEVELQMTKNRYSKAENRALNSSFTPCTGFIYPAGI